MLEREDMLALIQMAQANLTRISNRFILEVEQEDLEAVDQLEEMVAPKPVNPTAMNPERAKEFFKRQAK